MLVQNLLCVSLVATVCAVDVKPSVGGGFRASRRTAPWHAGLYKKTTTPYMQICGGTLISRAVVVSAAHCFSADRQRPSVANYAVAVGKIYRPWNDTHDTTAQKSDVQAIRIPPRYQGSTANFQHDIALVVVVEDFIYTDYVRPACFSFDDALDEEQLKEGRVGKVVGWGLTGENSPRALVLQAAMLPIVSIDKCIDESPASFRSSITGDKICAGYNNGTAVCRGDSGGGLVFPAKVNGFERFFLRGIVSTAPTTENKCNIHTWATFTHLHIHERFMKSLVPEPDTYCQQIVPSIEDRLGDVTVTTPISFKNREEEKCNCTCKTYEIISFDP